MNQSICINRISHIGRGRMGGKFCRASRKRCVGIKMFFCVTHDMVIFAWSRATSMLLFLEADE
jgi:hypothetical protein